MKNANLPAMPQSFSMNEQECGTAITHMQDEERFSGLTKREMFAMHAMSTALSKYNPFESGHFDSSDWQETAENCVGLADALLAELEK